MSILDYNLEKEAPFDPGYSASVARVSGNVEYLYSMFASISSLKQKRFQFSVLYPKLLNAIDLNISFYLGCLLWGVYLKSLPEVPVVQNPCFGTIFDDDCFQEVDFLSKFIREGLNRDVKYYLNKTYVSDPLYIKILDVYREFLGLNKGFVETKMTTDILLPASLKNPSKEDLAEILAAVKEVVQKDNLIGLLKMSEKIL